MPNMTVVDMNPGSVALGDETFDDELLTFGGVATYPAGTILARNTSTLKLQLYVKAGVSNGNGVPTHILPYSVTSAGAGDVKVRPLTGGRVNFNRLIINAQGDNSALDATVKDLLKDQGFIVEQVKSLPGYDQHD